MSGERSHRRALTAIRRELRYRPLLIVLAVALLLRIALFAFYSPGILYGSDSARFARSIVGLEGQFDDYWMPAGYPIWLSGIRALTDQLWVPMAIQHLIAIGTAIAVYLTALRIGLSRPFAVLCAAILLLSGDLLFLEHALLIDSLMLSLTCLACCATIAGLVPRPDLRWLAVAGALAGTAMVFRSVAIVIAPALGLVALLASAGWRPRLAGCGAVVGGAALVLAIYLAAFNLSDGRYAGMTDMSGWNLYSRVAPVADCTQFDVPAGTESLCPSARGEDRPGPAFYAWFTPPSTAGSKTRGRFARAAITGQPKTYAETVLTDLARYVEPSIARRDLGGTEASFMVFDNDRLDEGLGIPVSVLPEVRRRYAGVSDARGAANAFGVYQRVVRIPGWLLPLLLLAVISGVALLRGPWRVAIGVFGLTSAGLFVLPVMTFSYDYRYGVPAVALLAIAAVIAGAGLLARRGDRRNLG